MGLGSGILLFLLEDKLSSLNSEFDKCMWAFRATIERLIPALVRHAYEASVTNYVLTDVS